MEIDFKRKKEKEFMAFFQKLQEQKDSFYTVEISGFIFKVIWKFS